MKWEQLDLCKTWYLVERVMLRQSVVLFHYCCSFSFVFVFK